MNRVLNWLRVVFRIEFRNVLANRLRTILLAALIGLPVAAIVAGNNLISNTEKTPAERAAKILGDADLRCETFSSIDKFAAKLPHGSIVEPISSGREMLNWSGRRINISTQKLNLHGLAASLAKIVDGRFPRSHSGRSMEIAATRPLLFACDLNLGDTIELSAGGRSKIVGVYETPEALNELSVLYPFVEDSFVGHYDVLVKLPDGVDDRVVQGLLTNDIVTTRSSLIRPRQSDVTFVFAIGCFVLAEAALIVIAAFIVGIRRRQREIGLMASCGATRRQVMVSVLASAIMISFFAVTVGASVGVCIAWLVHPSLDVWNGRRNGAFEISFTRHIQAVILGVSTAVASAVIPAMSAARMPVKIALSSRQPTPGGSGKWNLLGFVFVSIGLSLVIYAPNMVRFESGNEGDNAAMLAIISGSILGIVGFGIWSPWILKVAAGFASGLPLAWRLAVRETGRFRTRNGPIVTAILAGTAMSILVATIYQSILGLDSQVGTILRADQVLVSGLGVEQTLEELNESFDLLAVSEIKIATLDRATLLAGNSNSFPGPLQIAVGGVELLSAAGIDDPGGEILDALNNGTIISLRGAVDSTLEIVDSKNLEKVDELPALKPASSNHNIVSVGYLISESTVQKKGWSIRRGFESDERPTSLIRVAERIDQQEFDRAVLVASQVPQTTVEAQVNHVVDRSQIWVVFLLSIVTGLVVIAIATALASEESRNDQQILLTVGASPATYRHQAAARAGFLALLGSLLAIPAGILPAYGLISVVPMLSFQFPWWESLFTAIGLPLIAYIVTWSFCVKRTLSLRAL